MSANINLGQLRICVEKPLRSEEHVLHTMKTQANSQQHYDRLRAAFLTQKLWPNGTTIRVGFYPMSSNSNLASFTPIDVMKARREPDGSAPVLDPIEYKIRGMSFVDAIKKVVHERIQPICGLNFEFVSGLSNANVRIGFASDNGSWSLVGTDCLKTDKKTMNFAWIDAATIMHEFGHVLGMVHEHQNPNNNPIEWNIPAVDAWAKSTQGWDKETTYRNIVQHYNVNQINGSKYDPNSIMLYFFPARLLKNGEKGTKINEQLSSTDVIYISKMYPGGTLTPEEFYKRAYNKGLNSKNRNYKKWPWIMVWLGPLIAVVLFLLIFFGIRLFKQKKRRKRK